MSPGDTSAKDTRMVFRKRRIKVGIIRVGNSEHSYNSTIFLVDRKVEGTNTQRGIQLCFIIGQVGKQIEMQSR